MSLILLAAVAAAGTAPAEPRVFEKIRSDGVTVVCVRHDEKPTILTSRVECRERADWIRSSAYNRLVGAGDRPNFDYVFSSPQRVPTIVGR
ncbi:hypothetical protein ASE86_12360 [Sphingomonas sp. Leaf33]|uniref:hypothetical protein n=1 Tax=Sphingomonas sp. Leaf33 TaxID=1736215 RepID=UPI0006F4ADCB|nr:hypothetical protein [Sphingomonas sp. Leaf33]KQN19296.1 hypothetical protein ASE86_12360 [Sphingomonas sp. Leaf33]